MENLKSYIDDRISLKIEYSKNFYPIIYVDLLGKCNMNCNICYNSNIRGKWELSIEKFEKLMKKLPNKVFIRFVGGEPTIHPNFFEFISLARTYGHFVTVSSNGIMYSDDDFVKKMSDVRYNNRMCGYGITLNGGFDVSHPAWGVIDGDENIGKIKHIGLQKLLENGIHNIGLTAIIVRDLNESIIYDLYEFSKKNKNITNLKFRSVGVNLGSKISTIPYTTREFRDILFPKYITGDTEKIIFDGVSDDRCNLCCYEFRCEGINIKQIEFGTDGANKCWKRGYIDFDDECIYPFFEYETIKAEYYEIKNN